MAMLNNQIKRNNNMTNHPLIWNKPSSDKDDKGGAPFYGLCFLHYAHSVRKTPFYIWNAWYYLVAKPQRNRDFLVQAHVSI